MPLPPAATRAAVISNLQIAQHLHSAPQAHGTTCSLRLYVPNILLSFITELFGYLDRTGHAHFGARNGTSCLLQECQHATFIQHATLAFTGEWPLYRHLVETCRIVSEVSEADFVLAPAFVGTLIALGWTKPPGRGRWSLQWFKLLEESWVMQYGARTLIFASIDVPHLNFQVMKNQMLRPLTWVHQGDTTYTRSEKSIGRNGLHLAESVTVPHRTSQWLPFGFPPQPRPPKTLLLYGNINTDKKIHGEMRRMQLANDIASAVSALNVSEAVQLDWLSVKAAGCADDAKTATHKKRCRRGTDADLKTPKAAALASMKSRFCLCPSGDIPTSFTARLFFSVIHDCIPVVLDLWGYVGEDSGKLAFPFPLSIDWQRFVIVRSGMGRAHDVVRELVTMSDTEVGARLAYMRSIAAWLVYDGLGGDMSAEAALVKELESRVRARRRLVEPVVAVAAPAVPARVASHAPVPAGIQIPSAQPVRCSLNLSAPALADRAYFRLFGPSYRLHHSRGGDSRWKGVMQPALWRDGDLLIDVGGHLGLDLRAFLVHAPAGVSVHTFEPVQALQKSLQARILRWRLPNRTVVHGIGLGANNRTTCFVNLPKKPNSPSSYERPAGEQQACPASLAEIRDAASVVAGFAPRRVTQLQLNCEGCEYEVLPSLLAHPSELARIDAIEIQFHLDFDKENAEKREEDLRRYCAIERGLRANGFAMAYRFPFTWERWDRQPASFFSALQRRTERLPWGGTRCAGMRCIGLGRPFTLDGAS